MDKLNLVFGIIRTVKNWPIYFLDYFGLLPGGDAVIYQLRGGAKIKCRKKIGDRATINEVWIRNLYLPDPSFEIGSRDIVLDIGAHIGVFSVYAAKKAGSGAVYAYEPHPDNFRMLEENVNLNSLVNVKPYNLAVAGKAGKSRLNLAPAHTAGHSMVMKQSDDYVSVDCTTLNAVLEKNGLERVDFLKMDCEGAEYDIFFNTPAGVFRKIRRIAMETHDGICEHNHDEIITLLEKNGFSTFMRGNMLYASRPGNSRKP